MKRSLLRSGSVALALISLILSARDAQAVGTRTFQLDTLEELQGGELEGTAVDSRGRVRAGLVLGNLPIPDASAVWASLVMPDGAVLLATGNNGKIYRVAGGQVAEYASTGQLAVTSLALDATGGVVAGTIPNGRIFRIDGQGKMKTLASLPGTEHVWALAVDPKSKALFAATGPEGKLFRLAADGVPQVYFDSDEPHLISLAISPDGVVFTGSSDNAILYRIDGPGRASVLYDFPGNDVKALAIAKDGRLFAISNEHKDPPSVPRARGSAGDERAEPTKTTKARPKPGIGRLTAFSVDNRHEHLLVDKETHFQSLTVGEDGQPYVGTGDGGKVYTIDDARTTMLVADVEERQIGALSLSGPRRFVVTSDPPIYREVRGIGGPDATWASKAFDTGMRSVFGRMSWDTTGAVELSTRTGNTEKPDTTWSAWSTPLVAPGNVTSPPGRFVQVRARFARDPSAVVSTIIVPFVTDNARAVVTSVDVEGQDSGSKSASDVPQSGGQPEAASSKVKLTWKVDNADNDVLRYRLFYQMQGSREWRAILPAEEVLSKTTYEWQTSGLPEGRYRVRVEASDELSNPPHQVQRHQLESTLLVVDNTPPVFRQLMVVGRRIQGVAADGVGPITRIDVSVDPQASLWTPFFPKDAIFDEATEEFDFDVTPLLRPGSNLVAIRLFDKAGNSVVRTIEVR